MAVSDLKLQFAEKGRRRMTLSNVLSRHPERLFLYIFPGPLDAVPGNHLRRDDLDQVARPVVGRHQIFGPVFAEETQRHAVGDVKALTLHRGPGPKRISAFPCAVMRV